MDHTPHSITRRSLLASGAAGLAATLTSPSAMAADGQERPNILWLVSEDNNPFIGCYGDKLAHTPTIDALAKKGLLFRNAYSNAPVCAPSRFGILTGVYPESCAPANQMRAIGKLPKDFRTYPDLMREAGYFCTNNDKTDYNCDVDPAKIWDIQGSKAHWRHRPAGKPFMAVFNYGTTHESQIFKPTPGRVTPDMVALPRYLPDTPGIRQDYASYYNLMEKMDGQLATRLAELESDGLADDTIVFYYSDNGGVLPRSKRYCNEEGLRCALVIYVPPKWQHLMPQPPRSEVTAPVSFIDLAPTVLSLANVAQPPQMPGRAFLGSRRAKPQRYAFGMRNRMDERIDFQRTVTDGRWRYIRNYMPHRPLGQPQAFAWLAKGYQDWEAAHLSGTLNEKQERFFQRKPYEELYDLSQDPEELDNLANTPRAARILRQLRKALDAQMLAIHDNGFLPETMRGEGYIESRAPGAYPLPQVMALAEMAAKGNPGNLPKLTEALTHQPDVLRYWATTGLLILGAAATPARGALTGIMRHDTSPLVRIVAAEALAGLGDPAEPVTVLARLVDSAPDWQVQLHALNALTYLGRAAASAIPSIRRVAEDERQNEYMRSAGRYLLAVLEGRYTPSYPVFDLQHMMQQFLKQQSKAAL